MGKRVVTGLKEMCEEVALHCEQTFFHPPNSHVGWDHHVQYHSGICGLKVFCAIPL